MTNGAAGNTEEAVAKLRARLDSIAWYHTQEVAPGLVTPGMFDLRGVEDKYGIPADLTGMRVLEVGTFEGFWAFELERRGASVTAVDIGRVQDLDWPPRLRPANDEPRGEGFALIKDAFGSSVDRVTTSIYDATPEALGGRFDLVFCGSVLIHLRDPMLALERMANLCKGRLILAEEYSKRWNWVPVRSLVEFRGDDPAMVWWRPTVRTWKSMVRCAGFDEVEVEGRFDLPFRQSGGVPHVVLHATSG